MMRCKYFITNRLVDGKDVMIDGCVIVKEEGNIPILVTHFLNVVAVTSLTTKISDGNRLIMLYKDLENTERSSHEKFLHVIGKMIRKDILPASKYFQKQRVDEHLRNGINDPNTMNWNKVHTVQTIIKQIIDDECYEIICNMCM